MTIDQTRALVEPYLDGHDASKLAPNAVFINMSTGERHEGREAVAEMLQYIYHVAFDARAETRSVIIGEGLAAIEGDFVGRHIGDFAGVPATGREVRVPLCVTYVVGDEGITEGRVYMAVPVMMAQLGTT
jgi:predicted ester cyclase